MKNHLESAGKSLKSASSNISIIFLVNVATTILLVIINFMEGPVGTKFLFLGIVGLVSLILNIVQFFLFIGNIDNSGDHLIKVSKMIEIKPPLKVND